MSAELAAALAAAAAALGGAALVETIGPTWRLIRSRLDPLGARLLDSFDQAIRPLRMAAEAGTAPTPAERLRLQGLAAAGGLLAGLIISGPLAALAAAGLAGWFAGRSLVWRRERYRRRVDAGASTAALAIADALGAGRSIRAALLACAGRLDGAIGSELRQLAHELEVGDKLDSALERLRERCRSRRIDLIVAAVQVQRHSGGSLAGLLREIAAAIDDQDRVSDEARAASAQARFTSVVVMLMPLAGMLMGELASPGFLGGITSSAGAMWLVAMAFVLQALGLGVVRHLGRVET